MRGLERASNDSANYPKRSTLSPKGNYQLSTMLTVLAFTKLVYCNQDTVAGCPGMLTNALDENAVGQNYIADINLMPVYNWSTDPQPDDYGAADGVTPNNFTEYGYDTMPAAFANPY